MSCFQLYSEIQSECSDILADWHFCWLTFRLTENVKSSQRNKSELTSGTGQYHSLKVPQLWWNIRSHFGKLWYVNNDGKVNVYGGWVGLDGYLWALVTLCLHVDLDLDNILYGIALAQVGTIEHLTVQYKRWQRWSELWSEYCLVLSNCHLSVVILAGRQNYIPHLIIMMKLLMATMMMMTVMRMRESESPGGGYGAI